MKKRTILAALMILVISSTLITACGTAQQTAAPTIDPNVIYTQAAQTVAVSAEKTKAAQPPATATTAPTATVAPTNTMDPNIAAAFTATANAITNPNGNNAAGTGTGTQAQATPTVKQVVIPTATKAVVSKPPASNNSADKCAWVSNYPEDNANVPKNNTFDAQVKVKNTGTSTWDKTYALRYFAGDRMGAPDTFQVVDTVAPGKSYLFTFSLTAPNNTGKVTLWLVVQNSSGQNMCMINMPMNITE